MDPVSASIVVAMALQSASWQALPLTTPIPPMLFVCTPKGEARPTFRTPYWQIAVARTDAVNRARLYQVGEGHSSDQISLKDSLRSYEALSESGKTTWRVTYQSGRESLVLEFLSPPEGRDSLRFKWQRPRGVLEGACEQAPPPMRGWELREEIWR
jgi:hypothetical protein